ncbi:unnamed protein product [Amaranthus hypochondriacus]
MLRLFNLLNVEGKQQAGFNGFFFLNLEKLLPAQHSLYHGFMAKIRTIRKGPNLGARFYGCPNWPNGYCAFFKWEKECGYTQKEELQLKVTEIEQMVKDLADMKKKSEYKMELKKEQYKAEINNLKMKLKKAVIREKNLLVLLCMSWTVFVMYVALCK